MAPSIQAHSNKRTAGCRSMAVGSFQSLTGTSLSPPPPPPRVKSVKVLHWPGKVNSVGRTQGGIVEWMIDRTREWRGQRLSQRGNVPLQLLLTHVSSCPVTAHARTAHPWARYNVELQGREAAHLEGAGLKLHFCFPSGFRFLVWKVESLGLVGTQEVPQTLQNNCVSSLAMCLAKCSYAMLPAPTACNETPHMQHNTHCLP